MKKILIALFVILLLPIILFVGLGVALYIPSVQQWAVDTAAGVIAEETGWQVEMGKVRLKFPLDLALHDVLAVSPHQEGRDASVRHGATAPDTIAQVERLVADVALMPLLDSKVDLRGLELNGARVNTLDLVSNLHAEGRIGRLHLSARDVDLLKETAEVGQATLEDAHLLVQLADTAAKDTTETAVAWCIHLDRLNVRRSGVDLTLPGDTMRLSAGMGDFSVRGVRVDLANADYRVKEAKLADGVLNLCMTGLPELTVDSIETRLQSLHLTASDVSLERLDLSTRHSKVHLEAKADFSVADTIAPGQMDAKGRVWLSRNDLLHYAEMASRPTWRPDSLQGKPLLERQMLALLRGWLESDIDVNASAKGNLQHLDADVSARLATLGTELGLLATLRDDALKLEAEGQQRGGGKALLAAEALLPDGYMKGDIDLRRLKYKAKLSLDRLNLGRYVRGAGLGRATLDARLDGEGADPSDRRTLARMEARLKSLAYDTLDVSDIDVLLRLKGGRLEGQMDSRWPLLLGCVDVDGQMDKQLQATIGLDLRHVDLQRLGVVDVPLQVGTCAHLDVTSNLKDKHALSVQAGDFFLRDSAQTYHPDDLWLDAYMSKDTTWALAESGDLKLQLNISGGYEQTLDKLAGTLALAKQQYADRTIDQFALREAMPDVKFYMKSGPDNTVANILKAEGVHFKNLYVNAYCSPATGLNGQLQLHGLNAMDYHIDTIHLAMVHRMSRLIYGGRIVNGKDNPQLVFAARFGGHLKEHGGDLMLTLFDKDGKQGLNMGFDAMMSTDALFLQLKPQRPLIAYKEFDLNNDNFIMLGKKNRVRSHVRLVADDGTSLMLNSEDSDSTARQDLTLSLGNFNLKELTDIIPYAPHLSGFMGGDFHIVMDQEGQISVASEMDVRDMAYEGSKIGNLGTSLVYMQREDSTHAVQASLSMQGEEFGLLDGNYKNDELEASLTLTRLPLRLANGFVPDHTVGLDGYGEGTLNVKGPTNKLRFDGELMLDSAYLVSIPYGLSMRFDDAPVTIKNSRLTMKDFGLYANGVTKNKRGQDDVGEPLRINGYVDFLNPDDMKLNLMLNADNFQLINAKENPKSVAYGKCFVSMMTMLSGSMSNLNVRGRLQVLGKTDLNYVLRDSPLTTDAQLSDLVQFVDFNDTTKTVVVNHPPIEGLSMTMQVDISQGAHVMAYLNQDHSNYVDLTGGGSLTMKYSTAEELQLNGRYTLRGGKMKYSMPVIPLKTFTIQDGSYIEFRGSPMNPTLNITATEDTKATVTGSNGVGRSVLFRCGVEITKTLSDMGLAFTLDAPEDMSLSQEIQAMSQEERGKLAVSLLTTGMYLAEGQGSTESFTMNSALTSFLNSEINQIAGTALRSVDVQLDVDNSTDASGSERTDYSFKFAKRFWNNRVKVQVGGLYSAGGQAQNTEDVASFFDNISIEYRLDDTANKYVNLFFENNAYDWLEGYTQQYGAGFIWRRTLSKLTDIFRFSDKVKMVTPQMRLSTLRDTTQTQSADSVKQEMRRQ